MFVNAQTNNVFATLPMLSWYENSHKNVYFVADLTADGVASTYDCLAIRKDYVPGKPIDISTYIKNPLTREGFVLNGWHSGATLTNSPLNPDNGIVLPTTTSLGTTDLVLYANWKPVKIEVAVQFLVSDNIVGKSDSWQVVNNIGDYAESFNLTYYSTTVSGSRTSLITSSFSEAQLLTMRDAQNIKISVNNTNSDYVCVGVVKAGNLPDLSKEFTSGEVRIDGDSTIYICFKFGSVKKYDVKNRFHYFEYKTHPQTAVMTYDEGFDEHLTTLKNQTANQTLVDQFGYKEFVKDGQNFAILTYSYSADTLSDRKADYANYDGQKFLGVDLGDSWCWLRFDPVVYRASDIGAPNDETAKLYDIPILEIKILFNLPIGFEDTVEYVV